MESKHTHIFFEVIIAFVLTFIFAGCSEKQSVPDVATLEKFDKALENFDKVLEKRRADFDALKMQDALTAEDSVRRFAGLAKASVYLSLDTALAYFERASALASKCGHDSAYQRNRIDACNVLLLQGRDMEGVLAYISIPVDSVAKGDRVRYHFVGQQIGMTILDKSTGRKSATRFKRMGEVHTDSLLKLLPDSTALYEMSMAAHFKLAGSDSRQVAPLLALMSRADAPSDLRQIAAFWLGIYNIRNSGRQSEAAGHFLTHAAISELRDGRVTGLALAPLGQWFYDRGDVSRGMKTWRVAIRNQMSGGRYNPWIQANALVHTTFKAIDDNTRQFWFALCILGALLFGCIGFAFVAWRSRRRERRQRRLVQQRLAELTQSKSSFVGEFMHLFVMYMERIEEQNRFITRKIAAGHSAELLTTLKTGKFQSDQGKILIAGFDNAFFNMFPRFVDELNGLLHDDKRFDVDGDGKTLTPELRIVALQRLGIDDSARVARFLGLSVNTVYAYRNKMRSRVVSRDTFDSDLMMIGACG